MSDKIFHNVIKPFSATSIAKSTTDSTTCEWLDVAGWTDKKVAWNATSGGSIDININMFVSSKSAYVLNNETTVNTEDYIEVNIVETHTGAVYTYVDGDDVDDLQRPVRSCKFTIDNDDATDAVVMELWVEGWS